MPPMREVAIIGAGELGGALARVLAARDVARRVHLIDDAGRVAEGKALDIAQSAPVSGFAAEVKGSTDLTIAAAAGLFIVADRVGGAEWQGDDGVALLKRLRQTAPRAVVVCAGAQQRELVDRGVSELGLRRDQLFGSAPEAMRAAVRALVALELNVSPREVALSLLGVPPAHIVIPWSDATVGGFGLTRLLDEPSRRRLAARIPAMWPPGPIALAHAACAVAETITGRARRLATCFVAPDRSAGARTRTAAFPVYLNSNGIAEMLAPPLSVVEQIALDNAMML
jgi:malate dehydrogenase